MEENPGITWPEMAKKIVAKFNTPEQQVKTMEAVLHMRQRRGEKVASYARKFQTRCIESSLDKYAKIMNVVLLSSLEKKSEV